MTARLHILAGPGGVGKTTLAAAYALALARAGGRVGLLGVDPSRRLQGALGLDLPDLEAPVPGRPGLSAALLRPEDCLRRWAAEQCSDPEARLRLQQNAFFRALADRLAGASDVLAAVRIAEWMQNDPELTDLVVDTAPGLDALELLRRPRALVAFMEGRVVTWLRWLARAETARASWVRGGAKRAVDVMSRLGGTSLILELAELVLLAQELFESSSKRLELAQGSFVDPTTEILLVAAVREDAPATLAPFARALSEAAIAPTFVILNRALPDHLQAELEVLDPESLTSDLSCAVRFARGYAAVQSRMSGALASLAPVAVLPAVRGLDGPDRLAALEALGVQMRAALLAADPGRSGRSAYGGVRE